MAAPDLSTFEAIGRREQRPPCKVGAALGALKPTDRKVVDDGLRHESKTIRRGARLWLEQQTGAKISTSALGSHRGRSCTCG